MMEDVNATILYRHIREDKFNITSTVTVPKYPLQYIPSNTKFKNTTLYEVNVDIYNPYKYDTEQLMIFTLINYGINFLAKGLAIHENNYLEIYKNMITPNGESVLLDYVDLFCFDRLHGISDIEDVRIPEYCMFNYIKYFYILYNIGNLTDTYILDREIKHLYILKYLLRNLNLNNLFKEDLITKFFIKRELKELKLMINDLLNID